MTSPIALPEKAEPSTDVTALDDQIHLFRFPNVPTGPVSLKQWLVLFFQSSTSQEHASSRNRLFITIAAFLWLSFYAVAFTQRTLPDFYSVMASGAYLLTAILIQYSIVADNMPYRVRYYASLFIDPTATVIVMIVCGAASAPFIFAFSWMAVGQGFRFGQNSLMISAACSFFALLALFLFSEYFRSANDFMEAIVFGFIILIVYIAQVQQNLRNAKGKLAEMAKYDQLSGLPNRRMFMDHLGLSMRGSRRTHHYVACFFFDLDGFKAVNDTYGHDVGDLLIKEVASVLKRCCRDTDLAARLSGDEFMIAAECVADHTLTLVIAERALKGISGIKEIGGHSINVSASIGVAFYRQPPGKDVQPDPAILVSAADAQMYKAKQAGKGCIMVGDLIN